MCYDYEACKISLKYLIGLGALGKIKFLIRSRIIRAQVPPSVEETGQQNYCARGDQYTTYMVPHQKGIPAPGKCTRSAMVEYLSAAPLEV
ncbi:hypothetical protein TNCV_4125481 [Trichonephila clavipes]|nr:hypothetical protein TNCV_4125481 [Trichonephila clavipes]